MNQITLTRLAEYLNTFVDPLKIEENSINGIQVAHNNHTINKIVTAVTASIETIENTIAHNAQVLIVHHGIISKNDTLQITDIKYRKIKLLIDNNIALLAYHLPLDAHREIGNNWKAAHDLGLYNLQPFADYGKIPIGVIGSIQSISFNDFKKKAEHYYGNTAISVNIKDPINTVAIVSGGGERFLTAASLAKADCLITGRVDEPVWDNAHESEISFLGLGHYATETVGPKALAEHIQEKLGVASSFIKTDNPF